MADGYWVDSRAAIKFGVTPSLILGVVAKWIRTNRKRGKEHHFHEGKCWMYDTLEAFAEKIDCLTQKQIEYALKKLEEGGALIVGNFNTRPGDRTKWYTLSDEWLSVLDKNGVATISENSEKVSPTISENSGSISENSGSVTNINNNNTCLDLIKKQLDLNMPGTSSEQDEKPFCEFECKDTEKMFQATSKWMGKMRELYRGIDVEQEVLKAKGWMLAKPERKKTYRGMQAFFSNWFSTAVDNAKKNSSVYQSKKEEKEKSSAQKEKEEKAKMEELERICEEEERKRQAWEAKRKEDERRRRFATINFIRAQEVIHDIPKAPKTQEPEKPATPVMTAERLAERRRILEEQKRQILAEA